MRIDRANLRVALTRPRVIWTVFGGAVGVYGLLVLREARSDRFAGHLLSELWIVAFFFGGLALQWWERDQTTALPFSFVLPGYRESLRRLGFSRAVREGIALALFLFSFSWMYRQMFSDWPSGLPLPGLMPLTPSMAEVSLNMAGGFLAGMALCLLVTGGSLVPLGGRWLMVPFTGIAVAIFSVTRPPTVSHPFVVWPILIPLCVFFCAYFWRRLGDLDWVKSGHRAIIVCGRGRPWRIDASMKVSSQVEGLFQGRMRKGGAPAGAQCVWAWLYRGFGPILSCWRWIVVPLVASVLVLGYVNRLFVELAVLSLSTLVAANVLPVASDMLLPEGRRERYYLTLATAGLSTLFLIGASAGVVALSQLLAAVLPQISFGTHHLRYTAIRVESMWLACLPVPWLLAARPVGHRVPIMRAAITVVVAVLSIGELSLRNYGYRGPTLLPVLVVCGWAFFPLMAWITYRRWDLAGQRPSRGD